MNSISEHSVLFSEKSALKLGESHCYIVKADTLLENLRYEKKKDSKDRFVFDAMRLTPFGEATIGNFTGWWLNDKIDRIDELSRRLDIILPLLVELKRSSAKIAETFEGTEYTELIIRLAKFATKHREEIEAFWRFIAWLRQIDKLAPCMFFTHPPWSTSQLSDRLMHAVNDPPRKGEVEKATEIVFGLRTRSHLTSYLTRSEMEAEIAEASDPETMQTVALSSREVFRRTSRKVLKEFATYFEKIRLCGEKISSELDSLLKGDILKNEQLLKRFINKAREKQRTETGLWDFKKTIPAWHRPAEPSLKVNFAVDVASFANKRGGLIVVGIANTRSVVGVQQAERRISQTRRLLDSYLGRFSDLVDVLAVPIENEWGEIVTSLVIIVPQTREVIGVRKEDQSFLYPRRKDVEVEYLTREDIARSKMNIHKDNLFFAKDISQFVFYDTLVGR